MHMKKMMETVRQHHSANASNKQKNITPKHHRFAIYIIGRECLNNLPNQQTFTAINGIQTYVQLVALVDGIQQLKGDPLFLDIIQKRSCADAVVQRVLDILTKEERCSISLLLKFMDDATVTRK